MNYLRAWRLEFCQTTSQKTHAAYPDQGDTVKDPVIDVAIESNIIESIYFVVIYNSQL